MKQTMQWFLFLFIFPMALSAEVLPRKILAFWDSKTDKLVEDCLTHRTLEMPLNHLGYDLTYTDIHDKLPEFSKIEPAAGILVCFQQGIRMPDPEGFIQWLLEGMDRGIKVILMNNVGFIADLQGNFTSIDLQNKIYEKLGFTNNQEWIEYPFDYQITYQSPEIFPFEKKFPMILPGFNVTKVYDPKAKSYLKIGIPGKPETESDLIILGPRGAYVSEFYANFYDYLQYVNNPRSIGWYFDPFRFFEQIFDTSQKPIPDTTTLCGNRIFFGSCHGDDWNERSSILQSHGKKVACSKIILDEIIKPHPDLPMAVAVVAADVDVNWVAKEDSLAIAEETFKTPQVEAATHTYSHPFFWEFFKDGGPEKEIDYLHLYPYGSWQNSFLSWYNAKKSQYLDGDQAKKLQWGYATPRAYANEPFSLEKEVGGSINFLNRFAPPNNQVQLMIWSGDSRPWGEVLELCRKAKIENFGGGFVRFDPDYPSYLFVFPLGRRPGGYIQLYNASNGDNDYTYGWTDHFYGFQYLPSTLINTEKPKRIKPIYLYYHSYSGSFQESVNALKKNIDFIKSQPIIPIRIKRYCEIGKGFYSVSINQIGPNQWKILDRKGLQTIRFDHSETFSIDFKNSPGVVGERHFQESLYVYLDAIHREPIIKLHPRQDLKDVFALSESNWEVWDVSQNSQSFSFQTKGWGKLRMRWIVPVPGEYDLEVNGEVFRIKSQDHLLYVEKDLPFDTLHQFTIRRVP